MSQIFEKDTGEIRRVGEALRVPQTFRAPFQFNISSGGRNLAGFTPTGTDSGNVSLSGNPRITGDLATLRTENAAAGGRIGSLIDRVSGNESPFIAARARPVEDATARRVADVNRSLASRGVTGSIRNNEVNNAAFQGARDIGDARAIGTQESINAALAAEGTRLNLGQESLGIVDRELQTELQQIIAGLDALRTALGNQQQTSAQLSGDVVGSAGNTAGDVASIIDILSSLGI